MLPLKKTNNLGRKRRHCRIEELYEINIRRLVTTGAKHVVNDKAGNKLEFVPQIVGDQMLLSVFVNGTCQGTYQIVEQEIPGWINNDVDPDRMYFYYVVVDGRRFKSLYVDPVRQLMGSRISLGAYYTSQSVSGRLEKAWRALRKAGKAKAWTWKRCWDAGKALTIILIV